MIDAEGIKEASRKNVIVFLWSLISITHIAPSEILYASLRLPLYILVFDTGPCHETTFFHADQLLFPEISI